MFLSDFTQPWVMAIRAAKRGLTPTPLPDDSEVSNYTLGNGIPCLIHQQWKVNRESGLNFAQQQSLRSWRVQNPKCVHWFWSDAQINVFVSTYFQDILPSDVWVSLKPIQRADLFRYAVVFLLGGIYADIDVDSLQPLHKWGLREDAELVIGHENAYKLPEQTRKKVDFARNEQFENWMFAARSGHSVLWRCLQLFRTKFTWGVEDTLFLTGPGLLSDAVHEFLAETERSTSRPTVQPATQQHSRYHRQRDGGTELPAHSGPGVHFLTAEQVAAGGGFTAPPQTTANSLIHHTFKGTWKR
jgi:hypothetical protein